MKNKNSYRTIVVDGEEYQWFYKYRYYRQDILIFKTYKEYSNQLKSFITKREFLVMYDIKRFSDEDIDIRHLNITPEIVKRFIKYIPGSGGNIITKKFIRELKIKQLNNVIYNES